MVCLNVHATVAEAKAGIGSEANFYNEGAPALRSLRYLRRPKSTRGSVDRWTIGFAEQHRFPRSLTTTAFELRSGR